MSMPVFRRLIFYSVLLFALPGFSADYYWVGGSGNWSDTNHWATASGGTTFHTTPPTDRDNVFFDANSFTAPGQVIVIDIPDAYCQDLNWTGVTGDPELAGAAGTNLRIYGSLTLNAGMQLNYQGDYRFETTVFSPAVRNITSNGQVFPGDVIFDGDDGQWSLGDALQVEGTLTLERGSLGTNNQTVVCSEFISDNDRSRRLSLTRSEVVLRHPAGDTVRWTARADFFLLEARNATIRFEQPARIENIGTGFLEYHQLVFEADALVDKTNFVDLRIDTLRAQRNLTLQNDMQIISLELGRGYECRFASGSNFIIRQLLAEGGCEGYVSLRSTVDGQAASIQSAFDFTNSYLILRDIHNAGATTFLADNSIDLGNNDGWIINSPDPRTLYWVDNGGNWYDTGHWSLSSGGPGGECPPTPLDDIIFDANSFADPNQVVMGEEGPQYYARDMTWLPGTRTPTLQLPVLQLFGSLEFDTPLNVEMPLLHLRSSEAGNTLTFAAQELPELRFEGSGEWIVQDPLRARLLTHLRGTLNTNNQPVEIERYNAFGEPEKDLVLGSSRLLVSGDGSVSPSWNVLGARLRIDPGASLLELPHPSAYLRTDLIGGSAAYHRILFSSGAGAGVIEAGETVITVDSLRFAGNGRILGTHSFGVLDFTGGRSYRLEAGITQTITRAWNLRGNPCAVISLFSTLPGSRATVQSDNAVINADYVRIQDQQAIGPAAFNAGRNSSNLGNNSGWTFPGEEGPIPDGFLGADRVLCGAPVTLNADNGTEGEVYQWSDGSTGAQLAVEQPGDYWVEVTFPQDCQIRDTVTVYGEEVLQVELPPDTILCSGETLLLDATLTVPNVTYRWQDGSTNPTLSVTQAGAYTVETALSGCSQTAAIDVAVVPTPEVDLGPDRLLCADETAILDASAAAAENYLWSDGTTTTTLTVDQPGVYWVEASSGRCADRDSVTIEYFTSVGIDLGPDTTICEGDNLLLDATLAGATYQWSDGSTGPTLTVQEAGAYSVAVTLSGCTVYDTIAVAVQALPQFDLGADRFLCAGETVTLDGTSANGADVYRWENGQTTPVRQVSTAGIFWLEARLGGCSRRDSVTVTAVDFPDDLLGPDTTGCEGGQVLLDAGVPYDAAVYRWSDGSTQPQRTITQSGAYRVEVTVGACRTEDEVNIALLPAPVFDLGQDAFLCEGAAYGLFIPVAADSYRWSDGSTGDDLTVTYPGGLVWGEATLDGCSHRDSIFIEYQAAPRFDLGPDTAICAERPLQLRAGVAADRLLWSTGSTASSIEVSSPGLYWLQVEEGICTVRDSIQIQSRDCVFYDAYFPNAFSPNGDGVNDLFQPFLTPGLQINSYRFAVFDRWGNQVFETRDPDQAWDGTARGQLLPGGVYVYFVEIDFVDEDGPEQLVQSGEVAIVR